MIKKSGETSGEYINKNIAEEDDFFCYADLVLEIADLNKYENNGEVIYVDKSIFDDFQKNTVIYIAFAENEEDVYEYLMIEETDTDIIMNLMDIIDGMSYMRGIKCK